MATATKTWSFLSDAEGFVQTSSSGGCNFDGYDGADGNPASGCLKWTTGAATGYAEATVPVGPTWQSLFGLPAGQRVTHIRITGFYRKIAGNISQGDGYAEALFIDDSGVAISATYGGLGTYIMEGAKTNNAWQEGGGVAPQAIPTPLYAVVSGKQAGTTGVRLLLRGYYNLAGGSIATTIRMDSITAEVTYETDPDYVAVEPLFNDCGNFLGLREFDARLFDDKDPTLGVRRTWGSDGDVFDDVLSGASFELQERGGFGGGSLDLLAPWDKSTLDGTERVDIWVYDSPAYRAYVRIPQKDLNNPESHRPQLFGMVALLDKWLVKRKYAYGCETDIANIFADIAVDYVLVTGRFPNCSLDYSSPVGATLREFDPRGQTVAQAFNALADFAPNASDWGARMDDQRPVPGDVLYFRPRPEETSYVLAVGDNVNTLTYPVDTHRIVNSLRITGGQVSQPNLAPNGGFEELKPASEDDGNYLLNPSFETPVAAADWTLAGGATRQFPGNGGAHGSARSGTAWMELDQNNETAVQTQFIVPGLEYEFSTWARLETEASGNSFAMQMDAMNAANTIVATSVKGFTTGNGDITSEIYKRFSISLDLAAYPTAVKIKVTLRAQGGSASNDGVLFDDCGLYEACGSAQENWRVTVTGAATLVSMDWASEGTAIGPRSGGLCAHINCDNIAISADTGEIYTPIALSPSVNASERYTLTVWYHVAGQGGGADNVLSIGAVSIDSSGNQGTVWESSTYVGNPSTWQMARVEIPTESTTAKLQLFIRSRTNRDLYLDDVMLVQGEVPDEVENDGGYWEADAYQRAITVEDSLLVGMLDAGIDDSITQYGEHEEEASSDLVADLDTALGFAAGQFNAKATPKIEAQLQVYQPREIVKQDGKVRLVNLPQPPPPLWPARTTVTVKGEAIEMNVELGNTRPDLAELLNAVKKSK